MMNAKGKGYERDVANMFKAAGWIEAKRHLEYQSQEAIDGRDLDNTAPFAVQCKCWKSTPSISAIEQVTPSADMPFRCAVLKRTKSTGSSTLEVVAVDAHVFFSMLELLQSKGLIQELVDMYEIKV